MRQLAKAIIVAPLAMLFCTQSFAVNPETAIGQYGHRSWLTRDGLYEGVPNNLAQTSDGYMWLASSSGLFRFDGVRFTSWVPPGPIKLPSNEIDSLLGAKDGAMWIGTSLGLARWKDGKLTLYPLPTVSAIYKIQEFEHGEIWFTRAHMADEQGALCTIEEPGVKCYGEAEGQPIPRAIAVAHDGKGNVWLGGTTMLLRWQLGSSTQYPLAGLKGNEQSLGIWALAAAPDDTLWVGIAISGPGKGLEHFVNGEMQPIITPNFDSTKFEICSLLTDSTGTLWIGTMGHGLYRYNQGAIEHFDQSQGLAGSDVCSLFEDREGDVWTATDSGIDKFSDLQVLSYGSRDGLGVENVRSVLGRRDGSIWMGNGNSFDVLLDGKVSNIGASQGLPSGITAGLLEGRAGTLWLGAGADLVAFSDGHMRKITEPNGAPVGRIDDFTEDAIGDVWLATVGSPQHLKRVHDFVVHDELDEPKLPHTRTIAPDPDGSLWLGLGDGNLGHLKDGRIESIKINYPTATQQSEKHVVHLTVEADGTVLGATPNGLIILRRGSAMVLGNESGIPCADMRSLLRDRDRNLWIYATCGYMRIAGGELERWIGNPTSKVSFIHIDASDGAIAPNAANDSSPSSIGHDGRLWFATGSFLQMIDPRNQPGRVVPTLVHIERIIADRNDYPLGAAVRLPPHTRDLELDYTGLNFTNPAKLQFQYQLEGRDREWIAAGSRRQAFYTDLAPGAYRFRVKATNNNGAWNEETASVGFRVASAFYQTRWFEVASAAAIAFALWIAYAFRVEQLARRVRLNADTKATERERIARDLHDTLLQGVQGLIYKMGAITERLPPEEPNRTAMEAALDRAEGMLVDGRDQLIGLRRSWQPDRSLKEALTEVTQDLGMQSGTTCEVREEGAGVTVRAEVCEELYRIAVEALRNAFRYSKADLIEIVLLYDHQYFTLRVRDNGRGFDAASAEKRARPGHFGLQGLKERADRIGAQLNINSSQQSGTEINCRVPAQSAYHDVKQRGVRTWFRRLFGPKEADDLNH